MGPKEVPRKASQRRRDSDRASRSTRTVQGPGGDQGEGTVCIQVQSKLEVTTGVPGTHEKVTGSAELTEQDGDPEPPEG